MNEHAFAHPHTPRPHARFGFRKPLITALLLGAALSAMQATLPPFSFMLASRFVEGVSHLLIVVAAPTLIARVSTDQNRHMAMTLWGTFFGVAFALVAFFGLPLVKAFGLPSLFLAHATAMLIIAIALFLMLPRSEVQAGALAGMSFSEVVTRHVETYRSPHMSAPALGWLFYTLSFVSMLTILPGLLPLDQRSFASATMPLAGIAMSLTFGVLLLRNLSAIQVVKLGFLLAAVCMLFMWYIKDSGWPAIMLFAVLGLVQGATFAAVPQLNHDPRHQAYANGAMAQMGNLGNLTGTVILLWMLQQLGQTGLIIFGVHVLCQAWSFMCGWTTSAPSHVLPTIDVQLGTRHIRRTFSAQEINCLRHFFRLPQPLQWQMLDNLFSPRRQD